MAQNAESTISRCRMGVFDVAHDIQDDSRCRIAARNEQGEEGREKKKRVKLKGSRRRMRLCAWWTRKVVPCEFSDGSGIRRIN